MVLQSRASPSQDPHVRYEPSPARARRERAVLASGYLVAHLKPPPLPGEPYESEGQYCCSVHTRPQVMRYGKRTSSNYRKSASPASQVTAWLPSRHQCD